MKKLFAIVAVMGVLTFGSTQLAQAQDAPAAEQTEQAAPAAQAAPADEAAAPVVAEEGGIHKEINTKFIEGTASFMSLVAIALVIGLAFCIERIIYLSLAEINTKKFIAAIEAALEKGDVEAAKDIARNTRGPIASIYYQGLMRIDQGIDVVEKSVVSYGGVQAGYLEKGCSWITLFIAMAPSLGFLGTVIGMVQAFDKIQQVGDISPTVVAGGMKVALITTIFGLIVALILQVFYNYILSKIGSPLKKGGNVNLLISFCNLFFFTGTVIINQAISATQLQTFFIRHNLCVFPLHLVPDIQNQSIGFGAHGSKSFQTARRQRLQVPLFLVALHENIIMYPDFGNGRIINRNSALRNAPALSFHYFTSPLCKGCLRRQIRNIIVSHIQAVELLMNGTHLRTNHCQIQYLDKMRYVKTGSLYICLMLTSRL
jgi:biopolymer transport protein ExbB